MKYWLWSIPQSNYATCVENGVFAIRTAGKSAVQEIMEGDRIFAYVSGRKVIAGVFRAASAYFFDATPIWPDGTYPHRIQVQPERMLEDHAQIHLDTFKERLSVGEAYPNFGLVIQKVVNELPEGDAQILESLIEERPTGETTPPPPSRPRPNGEAQVVQRLLEQLSHANQQIALLQQKITYLEELLALAGPNLEDYLRLAHSSEGPAFEEATRKCFVALGYKMDPDYQGQAGEIDFVTTSPHYVFGECQVSGGQSVSVGIVDKLLRHRRRYLNAKGVELTSGDSRLVVCENATSQLLQDAATEGVGVLRPSQLAALVKLKREYPGAVHPFNLRRLFDTPGDLRVPATNFVDAVRDEIEKRVGIIEVLKNDRFARTGKVDGRNPGWIQARLEAELETHLPLEELQEILQELTSPLVGCVGVASTGGQPREYFYIRDYDFQLGSVAAELSADWAGVI